MDIAVVRSETKGVVARPPKVLVPLIKQDIENGNKAGMVWFKAAGEKLLEAKPQLARGTFDKWVRDNFKISRSQAYRYMGYAKSQQSSRDAEQFSSLRDFERKTGGDQGTGKPAWQAPVQEVINDIDIDLILKTDLKRNEELRAEKELGESLINIGFQVLAKKVHPDHGGTDEALDRLVRVRKRLRLAIGLRA